MVMRIGFERAWDDGTVDEYGIAMVWEGGLWYGEIIERSTDEAVCRTEGSNDRLKELYRAIAIVNHPARIKEMTR